MALTGESETYRVEFAVERDPFVLVAGEEFDQLTEVALNLFPQPVPGGWKVPVITSWAVELDLDDKSDNGFDITSAGGEQVRRFFVRPGEDKFVRPASGTRFDNDFIMELSETNTWFPVLSGGNFLPQWGDNYSEIGGAVWIMRKCNVGFWAKQTHTVPATLSGYNEPEGDLRYTFTYHWRKLSVKEFEARKARI